jgi:DGQHR domain-containing protein
MGISTLEIPAIRITQQGKTIYIGKMAGKDIVDRCIPTEWDPDKGWDLNQQGYQRRPIEEHYKRIGEFLREEDDPLLPTSALLCARELDYGSLDFVPHDNAVPEMGILRIPKARNLFIVDYQHRWRGIQYAIESLKCTNLNSFQVPVIIMADVSMYEEIRQFYLINSKQKRVDTDLGLALLQTMSQQASEKELMNFVGPGNKYRIRATRLTFKIAEKTQGPWTGKIIDPNMRPEGNQVVSIKSFVDSLQPILSRKSPVYMKVDDELIQIILDYWSGIEQLIPNAFVSPKEYAIQATVGVFVMHRIAAKKVFGDCIQQNDVSSTKVEQILNKAKTQYMNDGFWKVGGPTKPYSSGSGVKELAELIINAL